MKISCLTLCIMVVVLLAKTKLSMGINMQRTKAFLCQYLKDPNLKKLVSSPNAIKVADACGSPFPIC
ncbi:lipid transfer protein [Medicago truncatula]|uniref:Lipid transfer protein n=1 Tax=Medicago truncatula TaxID=3880 RepID=G7JSQ0_MEDTR|nr:lipid transfer protein [Medicago truncatula]